MRGGTGDGAVARRFLRQALEAEGHQVFDADSVKRGLIEALDARADDYLVKPFSVGELLARVRAILRRRDSAGAQATSLVVFGDCEIDLVKRQVRRHGEHVHLTPVEYKLAAALIGRESQVADAPPVAARGVGPGQRGPQPLPADLPRAPAQEAGTGPGAAGAFPDRNRRGLPLCCAAVQHKRAASFAHHTPTKTAR